jgi:aminomethyltransferase
MTPVGDPTAECIVLPIEMAPAGSEPVTLKTVPLDALHRELGARMVAFAGYEMPVQYPAGIIAEHLHCRAQAALFDVSHMGQGSLFGTGGTAMLEHLVPSDIAALKPGRQRYSVFTNPAGGIIDDFMVSNLRGADGDRLLLVVNASRKEGDFQHIEANLTSGVRLERHEDRALLALQGPMAATALGRLCPAAAAFPFMGAGPVDIAGVACLISRSGYSGEDGFEISIPGAQAEIVARALLAEPEVKPAGLGARDSLRLEAGLCLYGNDIDELTSPIEAGLGWVVSKRRRETFDFIGGVVVRDHLANGVPRLRVGIRPEGRAPARAGAQIAAPDGTAAGVVTSGGFAPTLGAPIAMGYVRRDLAADGTALHLLVRGKPLPARTEKMPFVPHRYIR